MIAVDYSQIKKNLQTYFGKATKDSETIFVTRKSNRNVVILSEKSYNNLLENMYLTSLKANYDWLMESKKQFNDSNLPIIPDHSDSVSEKP